MEKAVYGLIGYPLGHSFSAAYFNAKFEKENLNATFQNFALEHLDALPQLLKAEQHLKGFSVTIPYKEAIIPYLTQLDPLAKAIGAVNCVKIIRNQAGEITQLIGYNTDEYGFKMSIKPYLNIQHHKALILGTGGASKAVAHALKELGIAYFFVSRNPKAGAQPTISYQEISEEVIKAFYLIINTTPLGTFPDIDGCPTLPYKGLTEKHLLIDLVYNPPVTAFLAEGNKQGCITINGLSMLQLQAEKAWTIWNASNETSIS